VGAKLQRAYLESENVGINHCKGYLSITQAALVLAVPLSYLSRIYKINTAGMNVSKGGEF
jgi:hypothetical protein